jgi:putative glutamine amidotransferase
MTNIVTATHDYKGSFEGSLGQTLDAIAYLDRDSALNPQKYKPEIRWKKLVDAKLVIFTGGEDINPVIYGHEVTFSYYINPGRDYAELKILEYALRTDKKVLGICRGHQLINAFLGGVLVQDLFWELGSEHGSNHKLKPENGGSELTDLFTRVNSLHHQGVTKEGNGLFPTSSYEGVYETCEAPNIITTQFHPEFMYNLESAKFFDYIKEWAELED